MRYSATLAALVAQALLLAVPSLAKDSASFLNGQYATEADCQKLRKIEAGTAKTIETAPELLDADGFHGWEGGCEFTKVFEHKPGSSWVGMMVCAEGPAAMPQLYLFSKLGDDDSFEVAQQGQDQSEIYVRCDAGKGR